MRGLSAISKPREKAPKQPTPKGNPVESTNEGPSSRDNGRSARTEETDKKRFRITDVGGASSTL